MVTGAHRSGTTWVGKMLSASGEAAYISEPLNILHRPGVMQAPTQYWYTYICGDNESEFLPGLSDTVHYRYHLKAELASLRSGKDALRMLRDSGTFFAGYFARKRPLLKDPFAVFSALWFAERMGCRVVITLRHPAGFASSLKRLGWSFDFGHLLNQPLLMRDWLEPFREEMEKATLTPEDIIGQGSLLWKLVYQTVAAFEQTSPGLILVRHEDLSLDPVSGFAGLYAALGLKMTPRAEQRILNSSSSDNPEELSRKTVHSVRLDSQANLQNWRRRLTSAEIERIGCITGDLAHRFYPDLVMS